LYDPALIFSEILEQRRVRQNIQHDLGRILQDAKMEANSKEKGAKIVLIVKCK